MSTLSIPPTAVVRLSRGTFDPGRITEVEQMMRDTSRYLIPAIKQLDGLIAYYAGASDRELMINVSIWHDHNHADQMFNLQEMTARARTDAEAAGVTITPPILNHPLSWHI